MNCPICNVELKMAERQGIEIDYCPQCRGIWLDRGELDKIIERSISGPAERGREYVDQHDDHHDHDDDDYYHKKRRRSFLENIFDFG